MAKKLSTTRKGLAIGLAIVGIAGLSLASAAQLNLTSGSLAAGTTVVAACQPSTVPIVAGFTPKFVNPGYNVDLITLGAVDVLCNTQNVKVTLLNAAGGSLGELTGTVVTGTNTLTMTAAVPAQAVTSMAVVIYK